MPTAAAARQSPWRIALGLVAGVALLNLALTFGNRWPTPWIEPRGELSVEVAVFVLVLAAGAWAARPAPPRLLTALAVLLTLLVVGRYAAVTAPALYGRPINLFWDGRHLPRVAAMVLEAAPPAIAVGAVAGVLLALGLVFAGMRWALARLAAGLAWRVPRRVLAALAGAALAAYVAAWANPRLGWEGWFADPVSLAYARQAAFVVRALGAARPALPEAAPPPSDLAQVAGADVIVLFAESYGAVAHDDPRLAAALAASRADLAAALAATGRVAMSAFARSPTFGGGSWLAHASLLSGVEVADQGDYDLLLAGRRWTLVHHFAQAGYRTLAVMPGLRQAWPEGAFYGFDRILDAGALDYRGPALGWWRIPDQFALARLDAEELGGGEGARRFVVFPTISSHAPFRPTPPYQPDWRRVLGPEPFDADAVAAALAEAPDLAGLATSYADSLSYLFQVLAGWLRERPDRDLVLVVLGDHQPPAVVSGEGAGWEVPVHVITGRRALADRLAAAGFAPGLVPARPALGGLPDLTARLLRAFDSGAGVDAVVAEPGVDVARAGVAGEGGEDRAQAGGVEPAGGGQPVGLPR